MLQFMATASVEEDVKIISRYIKKYGSKFIEHLHITKRDAIAVAKKLDIQYHTKNKSPVSNDVYDIFKDWILETFPDSVYASKIGAPASKKPRNGVVEVKLPIPMASQDKIKPGQDMSKFLTAGSYVISDKLDGISLEVVYQNGVPSKCYTRGDGTKGNDVSGVIPALNIPKNIPINNEFILRAEFLIKKKSFHAKHSKANGTGKYKTARNMGGGLLTRNAPSKAVADFDVTCYEILRGKGAGQSKSKQLSILKRLGFTVVRHSIVSKVNEASLLQLLDKYKATSYYEIDGIIVEHDTPYKAAASNPKHSRAFKVNSLDAAKDVVVKAIEWNESRHNRLIPRIIVDPVDLGGVEVKHFAGHNYFYMQHGYTTKDEAAAAKRKIKLPVLPINVGSVIRVVRSGDVIPYILQVIKPARKASTPSVPFVIGEGGVHAMVSKDSKDIKKKRIVHFFNVLDVDGLREGTVAKLYDNGFNTIRKILRVTMSDLIALDGFQQTSAKNVVDNLKVVKTNARFATLGYASNIFGDKVGSSKLQDVITAIPNIMTLATIEDAHSLEDRIRKVHGIADTAKTIAERLPKFVEFVAHLGIVIVPEPKKEKPISTKLSGVKILLTGVRDAQLVEDVKKNGGAEASSVKTATHVITKLGNSNNKTEAAEAANIPVMTIESFRKKFKI